MLTVIFTKLGEIKILFGRRERRVVKNPVSCKLSDFIYSTSAQGLMEKSDKLSI